MDSENQNRLLQNSPNQGGPSISLGGENSTSNVFSAGLPPNSSKGPVARILKRTAILIGLLLLITSLGFGVSLIFKDDPSRDGLADQFDTIQIPLESLVDLDFEGFEVGAQRVIINGSLQVDGSFVVIPSLQPSAPVTGQIYFDQVSNTLAYYNGEEFIHMTGESQDGVQSIAGLSGDITLGPGLNTSGGALNNSGVLTLQGQSGALVLTAGNGIAIDGLSVTNTGVLNIGGVSGSVPVGAGLGITGGVLTNTGVHSVTAGTSNVTVSSDGSGNVTLSVTGGTGTVISPGGTAGRIAKFSGAQTIEDSLLSESGTTITVNGNLVVSGSATFNTPVNVASGGTGTSSLALNGVLIGQGTGAVAAVTAGAANLCLMSTAGAPIWDTCPGSAGSVTDVNGQTGSVTIANASAAGGTITINDASTTQKGIAQFNATNFSVTGGVVNTIQNISTAANPQFSGLNLTGDLNLNANDIIGTNFGVDGTTGAVTAGLINGQTINSSANFTGTVSIAAGLTTPSITSPGAMSINPGGTLTVGSTAQTLTLQGNASTSIAAHGSGFATVVDFTGTPTGDITYSFDRSAAPGSYSICTSSGNCLGVGGNITGSGTAGSVALFTGPNTIGDSIISQSGATITITGDLTVATGGLSLANALTVSNGGTGATSLAANGVLIGSGTAAIDSVVAGAPDLCLVSTAGAPTWAACPGAGGVTSLNGLSGAINIANASTSGSTITLDDASTTTKGIASFNATNFTATGGEINTVQNISSTSTPTFAGISITGAATIGGDLNITAGNLQTSGVTRIDNDGNATNIGNITASGNMALQGGVLTVGQTNAQTGVLTLANDASAFTGSLQVGNVGQNTTYILPDPGQATATICLSTGNCAGSGGGIIGSGTTGTIAIFTDTGEIGDSIITQSGATVDIAGSLTLDNALGTAYGGTGLNTTPTDGQLLIGNGSGYSLATLTNNGGLTVSNGPGSIGLSVVYGSTANTSVEGNQQITVSAGTNLTGGGTITLGSGGSVTVNTVQNPTFTTSVTTPLIQNAGLTVASTGANDLLLQTNGQTRLTVGSGGDLTATGDLALQGGFLVVGADAQAGNLTLYDGGTGLSAFTGTLQLSTLGQNTTYILPDPGQATATICLSTGNCAGSGGGITGSGTPGTIAVFTASGQIGDSSLTDDGTTVTASGSVVVQGGSVSVGSDSQLGSLVLYGADGSATTLQAGSAGSDVAFILPAGAGGEFQCLKKGLGSQLIWDDCEGGGSGTSGVTTLNGLTGNLSIANASGTGSTVTIDDASTSQKGIAQFNSSNFTAAAGVINTIQDIGITANPQFAGMTLTGNLAIGGNSITGNNISIDGNTGGITGTSLVSNDELILSAPNAITVGLGDQDLRLQGNADSFLSVSDNGFGTLLTFEAPTANVSYRLPTAAGGSYDICTTAGNCAGPSDGITGSGTTGTIALFTGTNAIGDSILTQSGSAINIAGSLTLDNALGIAYGGTGLNTTPSNGQLLIGNGSGYSLATLTNNGGLTVSNGAGSIGLSVVYGSTANTAVEGNQQITVSAGTNLTGGGTITLGAGGNVTVNTVQNPVFSESVATPILQSTAGLNINPGGGTVTVDGNMNLTTGNQYQINGTQISSAALSNDANIAKLSASQTFTGNTVAFQNDTNSDNAFNVQNAAGTRIFTVDSAGGQTVLGTSGLLGGQLVFNNVSNSNTVTIQTGTLTDNRTLTLPDVDGVICTDTGNCAGAGATLQTAYDFSVGGTTPKIKLNDTLVGLDVQDADTTIGANLFNVRASNAAGLGAVLFGVGNTGQITLQNSANSTTAFRLLTQGGSNVLTGDTTNGRIILGQANTLAGTIVLNDDSSSFNGTLTQGGLTDNHTYTLPDESGTFCLQGSVNCGFALESGSDNYIQNQDASDQTANFRISGTGRAGTALQAPSFDTATASSLNIGQTNATAISIGNTAAAVTIQGDGSASAISLNADTNGDVSIITGGTGGITLNTATSVVAKSTTNSTSAFQVLNASDVPLFTADTTNSRVYIGNTSADGTGSLLILDTKNTSGDPTGIPGAMYYNSSSEKFRCYEYDSWKDCIGGGNDPDPSPPPVHLTGAGNLTTNSSGVNSANAVCNKPDNLANGHLLIAYVFHRGPGALSPPTGWTPFASPMSSPYGLGMFYRVITDAGSEPASYTFTQTGTQGRWICSMGIVTGADLAAPQDSFGANVSGGTASIVLPEVVTESDNTLLIGIGSAGRNTATIPTFTTPTGMTEIIDDGVVASTGTASSGKGVWIEDRLTAGATGTRTTNISPTASDSSGFMVAIKAAPPSEDSGLQAAYNESSTVSPKVKLDSTGGAFDIQDANTSIGADLFAVRASNASGLGDALFGVGSSGVVTFQNTVNSTGAFLVLNAADVPLFQLDTTNSRVYIGNPTADATGALLVLDTKNTPNDPEGVNGASYFNSQMGTHRCYEGDAWKECTGMPRPSDRRTVMLMADGSTTNWGGYGAVATNLGTVGTSSIPRNSISTATTATSGNVAGVSTTQFLDRAFDTSYALYQTAVEYSASTSMRTWIGLSSANIATMGGAAVPASGGFAAFRYDTGAGDTSFRCIVRSATGETLHNVDSGIALTSLTSYKFEVASMYDWDTDTELTIFRVQTFDQPMREVCRIADSVVGGETGSRVGIINSITTLTTATRTMKTAWMYAEEATVWNW